MSRVRGAIVLIGLFVLHVTVFAHFRPFGVAPDVLILAAVLSGAIGGSEVGARHGLLAGLLVDLMAPGPFGLGAGVYAIMGNGVGSVAQTIDSQDPRIGPFMASLGSFLGIIAYGVGLAVLGAEQYLGWSLLRTAVVVAVFNVVLSLPVAAMYAWAVAGADRYPRTQAAQSVVN